MGGAVLQQRSVGLRLGPLREDLSRVERLAGDLDWSLREEPRTPEVRAALDRARRAIARRLNEAAEAEREARRDAEDLARELQGQLSAGAAKIERLSAEASGAGDEAAAAIAEGRIQNIRNEMDAYRRMSDELDRALG